MCELIRERLNFFVVYFLYARSQYRRASNYAIFVMLWEFWVRLYVKYMHRLPLFHFASRKSFFQKYIIIKARILVILLSIDLHVVYRI